MHCYAFEMKISKKVPCKKEFRGAISYALSINIYSPKDGPLSEHSDYFFANMYAQKYFAVKISNAIGGEGGGNEG